MNIYDCFMYYDEDLLLDLRLNSLDQYVKKFVITESKWSNLAKHKKVFKFEINDIESISHGSRKTSINFNQPVKKLTMASVNPIVKTILFFGTIGIVALLTSFIFKGKLLEIQLDDQFGNEDRFKNLLNN